MKIKNLIVGTLVGTGIAGASYETGHKIGQEAEREKHRNDKIDLRFSGTEYTDGRVSYDDGLFFEIDSKIGDKRLNFTENLENLSSGEFDRFSDSALTKRTKTIMDGTGFDVEVTKGYVSYRLNFKLK